MQLDLVSYSVRWVFQRWVVEVDQAVSRTGRYFFLDKLAYVYLYII